MQGNGKIVYFFRGSPRPEDIRQRDALGATFMDATAWHPGDPVKSNVTAVAGYVPPGYQHLPRADAVTPPEPSPPARGAGRPSSASRRGRRSTRTTSNAQPDTAASTSIAASGEPSTEPT